MDANIFNRIWDGLARCWLTVNGWFTVITAKTGMIPTILGVLFAMLAVRFIIYPALKPGVGRSDGAKRKNNKKGNNKKH